jgi:hypothetical protein
MPAPKTGTMIMPRTDGAVTMVSAPVVVYYNN